MIKLLLVEDDESLGQTLEERLQKENYQVQWVKTVKTAKQILRNQSPNVAIIDIGLPDSDGFELARYIKRKHHIPFIFLTAMNSAEYRLEAFEIGADEYIPKPFHLKELLLRLREVLKRHQISSAQKYEDFEVHFSNMSIEFSDGHIEYPAANDFLILKQLIRSAPQVLSRQQIIKEICTDNKSFNNRSIDNSIMRIRAILKRSSKEHIRSVRGIGYQWVE